ncbi:mast cell protease 1A-like isoform X1 [Takifugu rubripes]|uniref:trypsin n=1 Tax=Takifugu rubripes TaxID=31033 RepID=A0A674MA21_TAKRU|nr:mast cell protease 1A-like isoform X1 [Takifugu rubripes]
MMSFYSGVLLPFGFASPEGASDSGIVGGKEAKPHSRPYMASLQVGKDHTCGGILIRQDFVLTSAHCKHAGMTVVLGAHNISRQEASQQRMEVAEFIPHPQYTGEYDYDVMLLKLKRVAVLNKYVRPIELLKKGGRIRAHLRCTVVGWGRTGEDLPASKVLKEATEQTQFDFECKNIWQQYFNGTQMICTKFDRKKGGVCQGDSGGPLLCNNKLRGLMAFTYRDKCSHARYPHVFMKVSFFVPWIQSVMQRF